MDMQLKDILQKTTLFFKDKGIESARLDTELLLASALKWDRVRLYMNYDYPLTDAEMDACRALVRRRAQGEPVAYILGSRDFYKSNFEVEPGVLIPRPETEGIVEEAVSWFQTQTAENGFRLVDMGCGSGCIGLSILKEIPEARLLAVDLSPVAIKVTERNAERLGVADRLITMNAKAEDLDKAAVEARLGGAIDCVVANPPYIDKEDPDVEKNVRAFEPEEALFSDEEGLAHIRRWARAGSALLRPGGFMMFEIGAGQGADASYAFRDAGQLEKVEIMKDLARHERFIRCRKSGENQNG